MTANCQQLARGYPASATTRRWTLAPYWLIASVGAVCGAAFTLAGLSLEGGAIAVLGMAPLMFHLDAMLMPELWFGPCSVYYLFHLGGYSIGPLGQLYLLGSINFDPQGFVPAQWGAAVGLAAFAVFYPLVFRKSLALVAAYRRSHQRRAKNAGSWETYSLILLGLGVAIYYLGFYFGLTRLSYSEVSIGKGTIFNAFQSTGLASIFLLAFCAGRGVRGSWWVWWLLGMGALTVFILLEGSRLTVLMAMILSAAGFHLGGVSKRRIFCAGLIAVALFVPASGIVKDYRDSFRGRAMSFEDRMGEFQTSSQVFLTINRNLADVSRPLLERLPPEAVAAVFTQTPKPFPYAGFKDIERVLYVWIPQFLWPDRPPPMDHTKIAVEYGVASPGTVAGAFVPAVADGYRRFGWPGIVLLYAFIASCYGLVVGGIWTFRDHREALALLAVVSVSGLEVGMTTLLCTCYQMLFTFPKYLVFFWLLRRLQDRVSITPMRAIQVTSKPRVGSTR